MSSDDNETEHESEPSQSPREEGEKPLDGRVERALAKARAVAKGNREKRDERGRWLALIPVSIALLGTVLMVPRATEPDAVPAPYVDTRALSAIEKADDDRAAEAEAHRLPSDVLAVGSAFRGFNVAQTDKGKAEHEIHAARVALDEALRGVAERPDAMEKLLVLRSLQLHKFIEEVEHFEKTGEQSKDLAELGGGFVARNQAAGWIDQHRVLMTPSQRRVAFKMVWNSLLGTERVDTFALSLDEQRALYALYLSRPHVPDQRRAEFDAELRAAKSEADCRRAAMNEKRAVELWRADKIQKLGQIDPSYPTAYALGVAYYRAGRFDLASDAFRAYIDASPDGPFALRARNHLKAALEAHHAI